MRYLFLLSIISMLGGLLCVSCPLRAQQKYVFEETEVHIPDSNSIVNNKYLSAHLNKKLNEFYELYTKQVDMGAPYYQKTTEIFKPDVYYSVQRVSDYFSKCLKRGKLSPQKVDREFDSILGKALQIFSRQTGQLETELRKNNSPLKIIAVFNRVVIQ